MTIFWPIVGWMTFAIILTNSHSPNQIFVLHFQERNQKFSFKKITSVGAFNCTGWGKITSVNFKVNNKKTIWGAKILFLDSEATTWEVLSLKKNILQVMAVVWVVFACRAPGRLQNGPSDSLDVLWRSRGPWSSSSFFRHTSRYPEVLNPQQNGFSVRYSVPRGDLVASTERTLHHYDRVTLRKVGFDGKCALLVGPHHLYDWGVL